MKSGCNERIARDLELLKKSPEYSDIYFKPKGFVCYKIIEDSTKSLDFIKEFVKYCIYKQRNQFQNILGQLPYNEIQIPEQFLIECIFVAILDLNENIGTCDEILSKLIEWLPILLNSSKILKPIIENLLKSTCCFKRLSNNKSAKKPSILAKREYYWSIDYEYLKLFVKYFERYQKYDVNNNNEEENGINRSYSIPIKASETLEECKVFESLPLSHSKLFETWKVQVENYKTFMEIKHSRFSWLLQSSWHSSSSSFQQARHCSEFDQFDFAKLVRLRSDETKKSRLTSAINYRQPMRSITKRLLTGPVQISVQTKSSVSNRPANKESNMEEAQTAEMKERKLKFEIKAPPPSPQRILYGYDNSRIKPVSSFLQVALASEEK